MASLEAQLAVTLFDRSARYPQLTTEGEAEEQGEWIELHNFGLRFWPVGR